ncbi:MAG: hypothetical protein EOP04_15110 [Proteobacteria bacterium]|nr:MAG: hypothetical protein EOP04_15110 [Pseudomonadota bacterium]
MTWHDYIPCKNIFGYPKLYPLLDELKPEWKDLGFEEYAKDQDLRWILGQDYGGSSIFTDTILQLEPIIMRDIRMITGDELQLRGKFKIHFGM